ncbi:MAG: hypothetical protein KC468_18680 [Myxococcales bacterium]|nr:hypothetical protein [Myxococcales bacterium]
MVIGGEGADGLVDDAWALVDGGWAPAAAGAPSERKASAVVVADGVVWLFGGLGDDGPLADLWRLG